MVVPAFHAGGGEDEFDERARDHEEASLAKKFAFPAAAFREEKRGRRIKRLYNLSPRLLPMSECNYVCIILLDNTLVCA
jgi:hypothetical protein